MRNDIRLLLALTASIGVLTLGTIGPATAPLAATTASSAPDINPPPCTSCAAVR